MEIIVGSPRVKVSIYTPKKVYNVESTLGDPTSDLLSASTDKNIANVSGTFSLEFTPRQDENGDTWADKLNVFDYVEIEMQGAIDTSSEVVMRGVIDTVEISENFEAGPPERRVTVSGRDLGALLTDFQIYIVPELQPFAAMLKIFGWTDELPPIVNAQEAFDFFAKIFKKVCELTVGKVTKSFETGETSIESEAVNLVDKIEFKAEALFPEMRCTLLGFKSYEGSFYNAFQRYEDKPFHELMLFDYGDKTRFVLRPARLKDMKAVYHPRVDNLVKDNQHENMYPPNLHIKSGEILSTTFQRSANDLYNYFLTVPEFQLMSKTNYRTACFEDNVDTPWYSANPYIATKYPTDYNDAGIKVEEPMNYIGRYGFRKKEATTQFIEDPIGQIDPVSEGEKEPASYSSYEAPPSEGEDPSSLEPMFKQTFTTDNGKVSLYSLVEQSCNKYGLDRALVLALIKKVSNGKLTYTKQYPSSPPYPDWDISTSPGYPNPSNSADVGLMGLNTKLDAYAGTGAYTSTRTYVVSHDPVANIDQGCKKLKDCLVAFNGDEQKALIAYKFGIPYAGLEATTGVPSTRAGQQFVYGTLRNVGGIRTQLGNLQKQKPSNPPETQKTGDTTDYRGIQKDVFITWGIQLNWAMVCWYLHNQYLWNGSISMKGTNTAIIGTYAIDDERGPGLPQGGWQGYEYYIEGVSHEFRVLQDFRTTLTVTRGQPVMGGLYGLGYKGKYYFSDGGPPPSALRISEKKQSKEQPTEKKEAGKPSPFTRIDESDGYYIVPTRTAHYGTSSMVEAIKKAGIAWKASLYSNKPFGVNDASLEYGGPVAPHKTHKNGKNVDIRPIRLDGQKLGTRVGDPSYDSTATAELVNILIANGASRIVFNDPVIAAAHPGIVYADSNPNYHKDHMHVVFA